MTGTLAMSTINVPLARVVVSSASAVGVGVGAAVVLSRRSSVIVVGVSSVALYLFHFACALTHNG